MKLIIAGSRSAPENDHMMVEDALARFDIEFQDIEEVVCGMARGADTLGYIWASMQELPIMKFPPDWDRYGKRAGFIRNQKMVDYSDAALFFWDGQSKGTADCIQRCKGKGIPYYIFALPEP